MHLTNPAPSSTSRGKYLYFAYGSNLSPTQMAQRCKKNPTSSTPLAIAFLPNWRWLICQAGYANVLPPAGLRVGKQDSNDADKVPSSTIRDGVYGVLYEMDLEDERILDGYEGVDHGAGLPVTEGDIVDIDISIRPREQGGGDYNKWYLPARVVRWLDGSEGHLLREGEDGDGKEVDVLVYVDEHRIVLGPPKPEYIGRMNRAIAECVELGVDARWIGEVMRQFIPEML